MRSVFICALVLAACSGGSNSSTDLRDLAGDQAFFSECGHPGDPGNSLGVGKFCKSLSDCQGNPKATLCTTLGGANSEYFCTFACQGDAGVGPAGSDAGVGECGENATCQCSDGECGCFPNSCM